MVSSTAVDKLVSGEYDPMDMQINARGLSFRQLNEKIRLAAVSGARRIALQCVYGQRYIGTCLGGLSPVRIEIDGVPGNDLGAFMDGHILIVHGNAQDGVGNTMHGGEIIVEGRAGDILGMSLIAGSILVRGDVGYRVALHMKEYGRTFPVVIIGGTTRDFLGEYMAGGRVVVLGLGGCKHRMSFIGTGMHGGIIYIRGPIKKEQLGEGTEIASMRKSDLTFLDTQIPSFRRTFGIREKVRTYQFTKIAPKGRRPYSSLYA